MDQVQSEGGPPEGADTGPASVAHRIAERRVGSRHALRRPLMGVPVLPDGRPDRARIVTGVTADLSHGGIGLEFEDGGRLPASEMIVGLRGPNETLQFAGVRVCRTEPMSAERFRVGCQFGGAGQDLLQSEILAPRFVPATMSYVLPYPEEILDAWCDAGVLQRVLADRVQLCPKCRSVASFRNGCRQCGSADVGNDRLIHHFACAHVGPISEFDTPSGLVCPKCRTRNLIINSDYEFVTGPYTCRRCQWGDMELEHVGQCLRCDFRFPGHQAHVHDLRGYRAYRLDPLAVLSSS